MSSSTYTTSTAIDMSKEKDWQANLGMLDWDSTSIVFTKRTLIEFLKYTGTTVDPNFTNISKLPRYAKFGKIAESSSASGAVASDPAVVTEYETIIPSRRVRAPPGGKHTDIFSHESEDDALSKAPPKPTEQTVTDSTSEVPAAQPAATEFEPLTDIKPSRRVRSTPGGKDSIGSLWDDTHTAEEFKPTRRVRQGPGGQDHISDLF